MKAGEWRSGRRDADKRKNPTKRVGKKENFTRFTLAIARRLEAITSMKHDGAPVLVSREKGSFSTSAPFRRSNFEASPGHRPELHGFAWHETLSTKQLLYLFLIGYISRKKQSAQRPFLTYSATFRLDLSLLSSSLFLFVVFAVRGPTQLIRLWLILRATSGLSRKQTLCRSETSVPQAPTPVRLYSLGS